MLSRAFSVGLGLMLCAPAVSAQDTTYVPTKEYPNGRQVVVLYFGAKWCKPCGLPAMKDAILRMKPLAAKQAKDSSAAFSATVVAFDRNLPDALTFVAPLGAFDEYIVGNDITNLAAERFLWGDPLADKALPTLIVIERTVTTSRQTGIVFGPHRVLRRVSGDSIVPWVNAGARVWK
ncbi:MAG: TlpA family protein disulfide reductase [Gemmatimonadota bacterium]|jgi:hypothetical protein